MESLRKTELNYKFILVKFLFCMKFIQCFFIICISSDFLKIPYMQEFRNFFVLNQIYLLIPFAMNLFERERVYVLMCACVGIALKSSPIPQNVFCFSAFLYL